MSATTGSCSCGCSPCACPSPTGFGCVTDMCVPRPCFFNGQLITSDDLNAAVTYHRTREAMLARLVGGWGVLGGLRVDKAPGIQSVSLNPDMPAAVSPNPQILAGTAIQVSPGVAVDANGRMLTLCSPRVLDVAELMAEVPTAPRTQLCMEWFGSMAPCGGAEHAREDITASEYWLVAEYVETPSRPVPQFAGGGACDPAPGCDYSRKIEGIRFRLVPALPQLYVITGCLDEIAPPTGFPSDILPGGGGSGNQSGGGDSGSSSSSSSYDSSSSSSGSSNHGNDGACILKRYAFFEALMQIALNACCSQPAVALARLIVTSSPGTRGESLRSVPLYVFVLDGYPNRRIVLPASVLTILGSQTSCQLETMNEQVQQWMNQSYTGGNGR
jgi:hypothetical protein